MHDQLLKELRDRQGEMSDRNFAILLGTSNVTWSAIKAGTKNMGRETLRAVARAFPDLQDDIDAYWMSLIEEAVAS